MERGAWTQVDAAAIEQNTRRMVAQIGRRCHVLGVIKADGYGHGAVVAAQAMLRGGAAGLVTATVGEARRLRMAQIAAPILVLAAPAADELRAALALGLTLTVGDLATLQRLAAIAQTSSRAVQAHLKIDTGMHRIGFQPDAVVAALAAVPGAAAITWTGVFTHFACADEPWRLETAAQIARFEGALAALASAGYRFPLVHAANSAATLAFAAARYDAVRPGIALYGIAPSAEVALPPGFAPALSFHTTIAQIADLPTGSPISYGGTYITQRPSRIATIPAGYADGLRCSPPWRAVLIGGQRAPIVGRICMDYAMVDMTGITAAVGDEVVLLGAQGAGAIRAEEVATWLGTSAYEIITAIGG